jgi:hypothetical protein
METSTHHHTDFQWSASELFMAFLAGVVVVGGLWLFAGLLIMLFML